MRRITPYRRHKQAEGFSLPIILGLGVIVATILSAAILSAVGNNRNGRSRLITALASAATDSVVSQFRALLNDTQNGSLYNMFWAVQGCTPVSNGTTCPKDYSSTSGQAIARSGIQDPSRTYWSNTFDRSTEDFCTNETTGQILCLGRQIAPLCNYMLGPINYATPRSEINRFFTSGQSLTTGLDNAGHNVSGFVNTYSTIGEIERAGGRGQLDVIGLAAGTSNQVKAENRARVSFNVERVIEKPGFAYLSAGLKEGDYNSIYLSNLSVGSGASGTILLRRNTSSTSDCSSMTSVFGIESGGQLPQYGGPLIHAPWFPSSNRLEIASSGSAVDKIVAGQERIGITGSGQTLTYKNLFVLNGGALFIETSDAAPVILNITDSLDVAAGGKVCNVSPGSLACGSGKAENLAITSNFDGGTYRETDTYCSDYGEAESSRLYGSLPGPTFTIRGTGAGSDSLKAFIYGKNITLSSSGAIVSPYVQSESLVYGVSPVRLVINRGLRKALGINGTTSLLPLHSGGAYLRNTDAYRSSEEVISVGYARRTVQYPNFNLSPRIYLAYNRANNTIRIGAYTEDSYGVRLDATLQSYVYSVYLSPGYIKYVGSIDTPQGVVPPVFNAGLYNSYRYILAYYYGIDLVAQSAEAISSTRNYEGGAWVRKLCFASIARTSGASYLRSHRWNFNSAFPDGLVNRFGDSFRWGFSEYRGRTVSLWDTLRDFFTGP